MNSPLPVSGPASRSAQGRNKTRLLVNLLVALVVVAVAAAAFVFSYGGVHAIALFGGVSQQLARYYPGLFDAVLVIACVAAVMLRDGRWWARLWAWVVIIVLLAAIATTDVLHAMNYTLRHRVTEGLVAGAPVVAVLLAFSLLLTLLRQSRAHAAEEQEGPRPADVPALPAAAAIALPAAPVPVAGPVPPTREEPALGAAPTVEMPAVEMPAVEMPAAETREPPTVDIPSSAAEPTVAGPERASRGIRYAGSVPGMAGNSRPAERDATPGEDYWEREDQGQFAGLVYPAREDEPDRDEDAGDSGEDSDAEAGEPAPPRTAPEPDDDAPPLATAPSPTAPSASVTRLNRVRSMPAPPADEDE